MADDTPVFLTDERRAVLNGEYDGADSTKRAHRSNIRARSRTALHELIEVARNPRIDNTDVFDPDKIELLVRSLLMPDLEHIDGSGAIHPYPDEVDDDLPTAEISDEFQQYADRLYVVLDDPMHEYRDSRFPDPDE